MAESMLGLKRSHRCTEVTSSNAGETVTVMGWVQKSRNKGGIIFVDLRDRSGILQIIFEESDCGAENFAKAETLCPRTGVKCKAGEYLLPPSSFFATCIQWFPARSIFPLHSMNL